MGEITEISWCDHTWNPWIGCTKVGPACDGCYAEALMGDQGRYKRVTWGKPGQRATHMRTSEGYWKQPLSWDRKAKANGTRPFVFCASLADVFDNDVPWEWRRDLFDLIRATPRLTWLLLTKRPQMIERLWREVQQANVFRDHPEGQRWDWPRNAAIGCTVVTQAEADRDVTHLLRAKVALKPAFAFLSMEPLLEGVNLTRLRIGPSTVRNALTGEVREEIMGYLTTSEKIDWTITGGETDQGSHKARMMDPAWARSLRDQCRAAGVPFHLKQMTRKAPVPADLQIQERPHVRF